MGRVGMGRDGEGVDDEKRVPGEGGDDEVSYHEVSSSP